VRPEIAKADFEQKLTEISKQVILDSEIGSNGRLFFHARVQQEPELLFEIFVIFLFKKKSLFASSCKQNSGD
jgi:hypothetical protein